MTTGDNENVSCPVCDYLMEFPPKDYNICPCCKTEFGYDDFATSHDELRREWLRTAGLGLGSAWMSDDFDAPIEIGESKDG